MTIPLIDKIKPKNNGQFPVYEDADGYGGYQVRADHTDRDSIPTLNRKNGMLVFTQSDGYFWQLGPSLSNSDWFPLPITGGSAIVFEGDLSGNPVMQFVVGLQGRPVSGVMPDDGYVLTWDQADGYWKPQAISGGGLIHFSGDLSGDQNIQTVTGLQNHPVSPIAPADGYVLTWDAVDGYWKPESIIGNGGGGGGGLITFSGDLTGNQHSQTVVGLQDIPVSREFPADGYVLTYDAADGYWRPEKSQSGSGGTSGPPNFQEGAIKDNLVVTVGSNNTLVPIMLVVIEVLGSGDFALQSSISYQNTNSAYWALSYVTGNFTVNGGSPAVGYFEQPTIAGGIVTNDVVTQAVPPLTSTSGPSSDARVISLNDTISTGLPTSSLIGVYMSIGFVADPTFSVTFPGSSTNPSGTISAIELSGGGAAGPAGPAGPPGSLSGGAGQADWSPSSYPNNDGPNGFGTPITANHVLEYNDFGNLTQLTSDSSLNPNYIAVADGSNPITNFVVQQGSFTNQNQMLSRSDRIVTQFNTGSIPFTTTIYKMLTSAGSGFLLMVHVVSCAGIEGADQASWVFILDQQATGTPTTLFTYNPFSITAPTFSTSAGPGTGVDITVHGGQFYTITVMATAMMVGGSI